MHLKFRNVNDAFRGLVSGIYYSSSIPTTTCTSRYGDVRRVTEPIVVTYSHPLERVLFNSYRDVNPFFHLYEALWMLAGRNDVASLSYYNSRMKEFSDDGVTLNGAYGYRWRHSVGEKLPGMSAISTNRTDQVKVLVDHLQNKPDSRRAVLQMWNVEDDLLKIDSSKDLCCNLSVKFSIGQKVCKHCEGSGKVEGSDRPFEWSGSGTHPGICPVCKGEKYDKTKLLNMTVFNRSNDLIWGMLGTNYVHFSFLQEYVASCLGIGVGAYNHITDDLHVYTSNWRPDVWLAEYEGNSAQPYYLANSYQHFPLVKDSTLFNDELSTVVAHYNGTIQQPNTYIDELSEPFLRRVAAPMLRVFELHKTYQESTLALQMCDLVEADDWRISAKQWLQKRRGRKVVKENV